ncbi:MAG: putative toxin-antitoxin system toxin component, PIN family [Deltaproteobacteria bacterium]|nr:putative toxin-antitoxin system toxin component, PIN family [Deltaproteobacteria bacterium]
MIPKIVIDTNIYISAILKPRSVVDLGRNGQVSIFTSSQIEKEINKKLKTKFGLSDEEVAQILFDFSTFTLPIKASRKITVIDDDPDDDKFIECAVASRAGFIVSGDKHLLNLKEYKGIKIMNNLASFAALRFKKSDCGPPRLVTPADGTGV